jgi:hypothetical protein
MRLLFLLLRMKLLFEKMERIVFVDRPGKEREADEYSASYILL